MTKNAKIALGCGGGGCLGLILLVIVCGLLVVTGVIRAPGIYNPDRSSNYNDNDNLSANRNSNDANSNRTAATNTSPSSSTMSEDDKHRLLLAASGANDPELMRRVIRQLGFFEGKGDDYAQFIREHAAWAIRNQEFYATVNTPEKARAYINAHIDD
jgi:hypothetical protein